MSVNTSSDEQMKECNWCHESLPLSNFSPTKMDPTKTAINCKKCYPESVARTREGVQAAREAKEAKEAKKKMKQ